MSTTGCHSDWSRQPAGTRCRADGIDLVTSRLALLTCEVASHHPVRRTEHAEGLHLVGRRPVSRRRAMSAPRPRGASGVTYTNAAEGYFDKRGLTRAAGFWGLWGLGVAAVISGDFS